MNFRELDPEAVRRLLDARDENGKKLYEDVLTPLVAKEQAFFRTSACPRCQASALEAVVNAARPFTPGSPLPNKVLRCLMCKTEFDPYTGLVTSATFSSD